MSYMQLLGLLVLLALAATVLGLAEEELHGEEMAQWYGNEPASDWSLDNRIPMSDISPESREDEARGKFKVKKKYQKYLLPLLLAYKLKFFTLIPVLIGGLILLAGATGLAGFFFALFAAVMGLKTGDDH